MPEQLIKKLQYKNQAHVLILQSPPEFAQVVSAWKKLTSLDTEIDQQKKYPFVICFVKTEAEINKFAPEIYRQLDEDAVFWMAYPKKSSKKYKASITRDQGWNNLGKLGFEPVSMIAIDEDWSALRFRNAEHISKMIRRQSLAMSEKGKEKTVNKTNKAIKKGKG